MHASLQRNLFFVREHVGIFKAANNFDILDPDNGSIVMTCREENLGAFTKIFRFTDYKRMTPFDIRVRAVDGSEIVRITRGVSIFLSKVSVADGGGRVIGGFQQKLFSIGGSFDVLGESGQSLCSLKGKWTGWEFKFLAPSGRELAMVTKKWGGLGKELFTSADNYVLQISSEVSPTDPVRPLILAAVLTIDMVLKE